MKPWLTMVRSHDSAQTRRCQQRHGRSPRQHAAAVVACGLLCRLLLAPAGAAAPTLQQTDVFASGTDGYFAYRIPALETAPDGSLLAFAEGRKYHLNDPGFEGQDIDLVCKRSADGGRTWSPMRVLEDPGEQWSAANPATLVDRDTGTVWVFYLRGRPNRNTYTARSGTDDIRILARTSRDSGGTWSEPIDLTAVTRDLADPKWRCSVVGPGGAIQTRAGRLVIPVWKFEPWGVFAAFSEDHGSNWQRGALVPNVSGDECQLAELANGQLLFDIRQQRGPHRWRATSNDGGRTWSQPRPGEICSPVACAVQNVPSSSAGAPDQLLWTGPRGPERSNLVLRVSTNDGQSFGGERLLAAGRAAYSDLALLPDGSVGVLWERGAERDYQFITFTRLEAAWFGKTASAEGAATVAGPATARAPTTAGPQPSGMKLLSREIFLHRRDRRPPAAGFVTYISKSRPLLMHCHGWEDYSDGYDDYSVSLSEDNGQTWTADEVRWRSTAVAGGRLRYAEPAAFFDRTRDKLIVLIDRIFYPKDKLNVDAEYTLIQEIYDAKTRAWSEPRELRFAGDRTPAMSFSFPIQTTKGRLLFPGMRPTRDAAGRAIHYEKGWAPVDEMVTVIGEYGTDDEIRWHVGRPLRITPETSSRGLNENTLIELPDGNIAAVCRGDNSAYPTRPGYKWFSISSDAGESWAAPVPLPATGGEPIESGSNGSALFRSLKNGRLYWLGNLALHGEHAHGNRPRAPLVLAEVQLQPFALKRDTIFIVDDRQGQDSPGLQLSNFRFYQDRETGDVVLFLTRYGEVSEKEWMLADYYRYRVRLPGAP